MKKLLLVIIFSLVFTNMTSAQAYTTDGGLVFHHKYHVVYVESHAPSFPIKWAVETIRLMQPQIDVHYGACHSGAGCAKVYQIHRGRHVSPGLTYFRWYSSLELLEPVITKFDLDYPWTSHDRYQAACHEVLRELGIDYTWPTYQGSCMYRYLSNKANIHPAWADIYKLRQVY